MRPEPASANETIKWRLFLLAVVGPLTAVSVGVDGGDIFQILAAETLDLDPRAVGIALLLGALSIPVQIWAARIPLARARTNIRTFLWLMGTMAGLSSLLVVAAPPGTWIAGLILVIAVVAEIAVSVLFATSWQPLISYTLTVDQRQFINGRGRAGAGLVLLGGTVLFGQLGQVGRSLFLAAIGLAAIVVGWSLHVLPPPPNLDSDRGAKAASPGGGPPEPTTGQLGSSGSLTNVFLSLPASAFASWPLLVSYAAVVLWPDGNLGLFAGAMVLGGVLASAVWRDPRHRLIPLIRSAAAVVAGCSVAIVVIGPPTTGLAVAALLTTVAVGSAARTMMRTAIMELAHRRIDTSNAVRVMTMIDVVGSTSFQVGAFLAGFLIAASIESDAAIDAYQLWLLATAAVLLLVVARFKRRPPTVTDASA